eukprot:99755-Pelagomonas_calceolata.AAC.1
MMKMKRTKITLLTSDHPKTAESSTLRPFPLPKTYWDQDGLNSLCNGYHAGLAWHRLHFTAHNPCHASARPFKDTQLFAHRPHFIKAKKHSSIHRASLQTIPLHVSTKHQGHKIQQRKIYPGHDDTGLHGSDIMKGLEGKQSAVLTGAAAAAAAAAAANYSDTLRSPTAEPALVNTHLFSVAGTGYYRICKACKKRTKEMSLEWCIKQNSAENAGKPEPNL